MDKLRALALVSPQCCIHLLSSRQQKSLPLYSPHWTTENNANDIACIFLFLFFRLEVFNNKSKRCAT